MPVARALSPNEAEFEFYNRKLSGALQMQLCLRLEGPLTFELVQRALRLLQQEHTLLQARIASVDGALHYEVDPALRLPARQVERTEPEQWRAVIREELNASLDSAEGLMRVSYIPAGAGTPLHDLVIKSHHGIMDAAAMMRVYGRLLELCGELAAGREPAPVPARPVSPPTTELLPLKGVALALKKARFMAHMMGTLLTKKPRPLPITDFAPVDEQQSSFEDLRVPADVLAPLVERAREERSSITAALAAAMLLTIRKGLPGEGPMNLAWLSPLSYRNAIQSEFADPSNLAFAFGTGMFVNAVDARNGTFWDLARATKANIEAALASQLHYTTPHLAKLRLSFFEKEKPPAMVLSFSNMGTFQVADAFGPLTLREIQFTPAIRGYGPLWVVHAYTYREELYLHLGFAQPLLRPEAARAWLDSVVGYLRASLAR
ncbi:phthiocerol/phthiodiolone dimycocerosyl transferase family protein [Pyxidicoccus xibeiensis]|uniref:phthiocerol/phthiodiolone dimycocerosyl transferase family protein n=1 Tax=Pyxidicoccus xibeiensis TaxID=2906759 RepID=UPI0020A787B9|nr:hypothetical protein [Pyxidicoccus xibeiensis]MCP3143688.1 hypothetical protein [Pyxidicoccus xibeiensis]